MLSYAISRDSRLIEVFLKILKGLWHFSCVRKSFQDFIKCSHLQLRILKPHACIELACILIT